MRLQPIARNTYRVLAWAFLAAVVLQVFYAGAGTFSDGTYLVRHVRFVEWFQPLPIFLVLTAFLGRLSRFLKAAPAVTFGALALQYEFVKASPHLVAGLHTVNALLIFWLAVEMARRSAARMPSAPEAGETGTHADEM